jgi:hypothetical protein
MFAAVNDLRNRPAVRYNCPEWSESPIVCEFEPFRKDRWNMRKTGLIAIAVFVATEMARISPAAAQGELGRLESSIRVTNVQPPVAAMQRVYLGARADDDAGRGVRVLSVQAGGPADRAGLQPQDLIVSAAGRKVRFLNELSNLLNSQNPGDRVGLEVMRGIRPLHADVVLGSPPGAAQLAQPVAAPLSGLGAGRTESIPPPPGEATAPSLPSEGRLLNSPATPGQPYPPKSIQAQIEELRRRIDQLERRVEELQRELAETRRK